MNWNSFTFPDVNIFNEFLLDLLSLIFEKIFCATFSPGSINLIFGNSFFNNDLKKIKWVLESVMVSIDSWDKISKSFLIILLQYFLSVWNFPDSTKSTRLEPLILKILKLFEKLFFIIYFDNPLL